MRSFFIGVQRLAHVWRADGTLHNLALLREGFALHNDYGTASVHKLEYQEGAKSAEQYQLGLWGNCQ